MCLSSDALRFCSSYVNRVISPDTTPNSNVHQTVLLARYLHLPNNTLEVWQGEAMDKRNSTSVQKDVDARIFGEKVGLFSRLFGCRHSRMSRPVTTGSLTYQYCAACGVRRKYNPKTFKPGRIFYYPGNQKNLHHV